MIGKITPLVQAAGRRTWSAAASAHALGSTLSGAVLGLILGGIGLAIGAGHWGQSTAIIGGVLLFACALRDAEVLRLSLPSLKRQTPSWCKCALGPAGGGFVWGLDLGQGWTTHILFTGYYGLVLWTVLDAAPFLGAVALGCYGLGRALPVVVAGLGAGHGQDVDNLLWYGRHLWALKGMNAAALAVMAGFVVSSIR